MLLKKHFFFAFILILTNISHGFAAANFTIEPVGTLPTHVLPGSTNILPFLITNQTSSTRSNYRLNTLPSNVKQLYLSQQYTDKVCGNPFSLAAKKRCLLLLEVTGAASFEFSICSGTSCTRSAVQVALQTASTEAAFPFGVAPSCNLSLAPLGWQSQYATPETMLGSWAMQQAIVNDLALTNPQQLPANDTLTLDASNTVYAVGTAAVGSFFPSVFSGQCNNGCNAMGGQCFAIRFNEKTQNRPYPYMIFQSVNTGANKDSFDIYMAGGGCGVNCSQCPTFWNASNINFSSNIGNTHPSGYPCDAYFSNYQSSDISSSYTVTYNGITYGAVQTLQNACAYALPPSMSSTGSSGVVTGTADFNMGAAQDGYDANFYDISAVPVTCPQYLTQVTGLAVTIPPIPTSITLADLKESDFDNAAIQIKNTPSDPSGDCYGQQYPLPNGCPATTQMQDCKTPTTGWNTNNPPTNTNYAASFSATTEIYNSTAGASAPYTTIPGTTTIISSNGNDCYK